MNGRTREVRRDDPSATLGDLLYADKSRNVVPESEWAALVQSVAARDPMALHALYERTHRLVFTLALRLSGSRETAEELTVDVLHDVWRKASTYDPAAGTVLAWIMNQARSRTIDRLRHDHRQKRVDPGTQGAESEADPSIRDGVDVLGQAQAADTLRAALTVLTADERQAVETAYFADMTHAEVAVKLNQPLGTIKSRIRSALVKLRRALGGEAPA